MHVKTKKALWMIQDWIKFLIFAIETLAESPLGG